jgi:hypothetical protein
MRILAAGVRSLDLASRAQVLDLTLRRVAAGRDARVEASRAGSSLASARIEAALQDQECNRQTHALHALTGLVSEAVRANVLSTDESRGPSEPHFMPSVPSLPPALPASVLGQHPDLLAADRDAAAAWSEIGVAKAERLPRIDLSALLSGNWFSCGGLMAIGIVADPRITTWGVTSSGMARVSDDFYKLVRTPVLFVEGGTRDMANAGGQKGYENIARTGVPVLWFSKEIGHGGDLSSANGGDFTRINLAWLNWWLKGDETATGKGLLVGESCPYCKDDAWEVKAANIP